MSGNCNSMPCHISDGPQTPEDVQTGWEDVDDDEIYEMNRQDEIDSGAVKQ